VLVNKQRAACGRRSQLRHGLGRRVSAYATRTLSLIALLYIMILDHPPYEGWPHQHSGWSKQVGDTAEGLRDISILLGCLEKTRNPCVRQPCKDRSLAFDFWT
jgi:hypothetical protein